MGIVLPSERKRLMRNNLQKQIDEIIALEVQERTLLLQREKENITKAVYSLLEVLGDKVPAAKSGRSRTNVRWTPAMDKEVTSDIPAKFIAKKFNCSIYSIYARRVKLKKG